MTLSKTELILSLPTTILNTISFFAALYIAFSAWLMHRARKEKLKTILNIQGSHGGVSQSASYSSHTNSHHLSIIHCSPTALDLSFCYERPELICHHIFYMAICDALFSLWNLCSWLPKLFESHFVDSSNISCKIFGVVEQFIMSAGVLWYLMIAWFLFSVLFGTNNDHSRNFNKTKKIHHFIVWFTALICTVIPLYPFDEYGEFENVSREDVMGNDTECWITNQLYFISFYALVGISLFFAIFLLIYISIRWNCPLLRLCKHKKTKKYRYGIRFICCPQLCIKRRRKYLENQKQIMIENSFIDRDEQSHENNIENTPQSKTDSLLSGISTVSSISSTNNIHFSQGYVFGGLSLDDGDIISRLELFTIVFIIVWIAPFSVRMYNFICKDCIAPLWATAMHHYGISLLGLGNAIVWSKSKNFNSPFKSYQQINKEQQIQYEEDVVGAFTRTVGNI
eukprot:175737_1